MAERVGSESYKCTLSDVALKKAKRELNEDPATRQRKINDLQDLFKTRPDIKFRQDDAFLLKFLRDKKFDVSKAFKTLTYYYEVRRSYRDVFRDFTPSAFEHIYDPENEMICPGRDCPGKSGCHFASW
ncbi:alpha-tocopherol transfer protein-like [Ptychodera flava]|uniref:alpha-tocopherol transfer protein-like n=1 Tax=Ptychodera flava TaxID=63121 RepID=UPI003969E47C